MAGLDQFFDELLSEDDTGATGLDAFMESLDKPNDNNIPQKLPKANLAEERRVRELSEELQAEPQTVRANPDHFERVREQQEVTKAIQAAPTLASFLGDPEKAPLAANDIKPLSALELIMARGNLGILTTQFGQAQFEAMNFDADSLEQSRADDIKKRMDELQAQIAISDDTGAKSYFAAAAELLTQQLETFNSPEAALRLGVGGGIGLATGLAAAPVTAGLSVPALTVGGVASGAVVHVTTEAFENEMAFMFDELTEAGVDRSVAVAPSVAAGAMNAALEITGLTLVAKPFISLGKAALRKRIAVEFAKEGNKRLLLQFSQQYGAGVLGETATEVMQEMVNIAVFNFQSQFSDDIEAISGEEALDRLAQVSVQVLKGMVVLGPIGPAMNARSQFHQARAAEKFHENLLAMHEQAMEAEMATQAPELFGDIAGTMMADAGAPDVFIDADTLANVADEIGRPGLVQSLGVEGQIRDARRTGDGVRITSQKFAEIVLANPEVFQALSPHVRQTFDGKSQSEAEALAELGLSGQIEEAFDTQANPEDGPIVAETEELAVGDGITQEIAAADLATELAQSGPGSFSILNSGKLGRVEQHQADLKEQEIQISTFKSEGVDAAEIAVTVPANGVTKAQAKALKRALSREPKVTIFDTEGERIANLDAVQLVDTAETQDAEVASAEAEAQAQIAAEARDVAERAVEQIQSDIDARLSNATAAVKQAAREGGGEVLKLADTPETTPENVLAADIAFGELGLVGMFKTAQEAGMTDLEYAKYLEQIKIARDKTAVKLQDDKLKQEQRELTAEWKKAQADTQVQVEADLRSQPVYAVQENIQQQRLDRAQTLEALEELGVDPKALPKQKGNRRLFAAQGEAGTDIDFFAQQHGYEDGVTMLEDIVTAQPFEEAVADLTATRMKVAFGDLNSRVEAVARARKLLHEAGTQNVLTAELNALRKARGQARVNAKLLKREALELLNRTAIRDATPARFFAGERRHGATARQAIRKGDFRLAEQAKFRQLLNFQMAKEAIKAQERMQSRIRRIKAINKTARGKKNKANPLPVPYQDAITELVSAYQLSGTDPAKRGSRSASALAKHDRNPTQVLDSVKNNAKFWKDATVADMDALYETIKDLNKKGRDEKKVRKNLSKLATEFEARNIMDRVVEMPQQNRAETDSVWDRARRFHRDYRASILNADTILRQLDNWEDLGFVWQLIKGRHDMALNQGYHEGDLGWNIRNERVGEEMVRIYGLLDQQTRDSLHKRVKGLPFKITNNEKLSLILNWGNPEGRQAVIESGQFTEEQVQQVIDTMTESEFQFIGEVHDYLESFWPEVKAKEQSRRDFTPVKVEALEIETPHGTLPGGYYPLRYDQNKTLFEEETSLEEVVDKARAGQFISSHTARWHTQEREKHVGKPVRLHLSSLHRHLHQLTWDLEMGDALSDAYKVWHFDGMRQAFKDQGWEHYWESIDLWLRDVTTGEIAATNTWESLARHLRAGFTISKLGFNLKTIAVQPLGFVSTAAELGKWRTFTHLHKALGLDGGRGWREASELSAFMRQRDEGFNADLKLVNDQLRETWVKALAGKQVEKIVRDYSFIGLKKSQKIVDIGTWWAAYDKGMEQFRNNQKKAIEFADLMVARTQGSGVFGQRTAVERGSVPGSKTQSEYIRLMTPFMSYFIAKNNVAFERFKKTHWKNPIEAGNFIIDMAMLYFLEAFALTLLMGTEEDESILEATGKEALLGYVAGKPLIRDIVAGTTGFSSGRLDSSVQDLRGMMTGFSRGMEEGEWFPFARSSYNVGATVGQLPGAAQFSRTGKAAVAALDGEDVSLMEFIFGVRKE